MNLEASVVSNIFLASIALTNLVILAIVYRILQRK